MRVRLAFLLLLCLPAFAASPDMQWQAPRILPPKGEAPSAGSAGAAPAAASSPAAVPKPVAAQAQEGAAGHGAGGATPANGANVAHSKAAAAAPAAASAAAAKPASAPALAARIKEKLEQTQLPPPRHPRASERTATASFMTQQEFRARLAAAAAVKAEPAAPKVLNLTQAKKPVHVAKAKPHSGHWSYSGEEGPEYWAQLSPEWARCGNGNRQSPIDIRDGFKLELEAPLFEYQPSRFSVLDNGHTIQANINSPNFASLMGRRFQLLQFHFHRPAEERLEGRGYEMVLHLVHKDDEGRLMVVAVMIEPGAPNAQVQSVWNNLPLEKNESLTPASRLELEQLLPARRDYYTYMGSLTTPPCSEGVLWVVMKQAITLSPQQINIFARLYPMNARPLQPAGDRLIKESS